MRINREIAPCFKHQTPNKQNNAKHQTPIIKSQQTFSIMKKLLLLLLVLSVFASYAQVPSYVPTNGLVGYWPFNGNANDESGNGNNGTVNGATLTTDRFGNANGAYHFTLASSNYISTPGNNLPIGSSSSTMSIWFNAAGFSNSGLSRAMLSYGIWNSNKARYIGQRGGSANVLTYAQLFNDKNCTFNYSLNTWYNFVVTYDTGVVKMYINSNLIGTYTITGTATSQGNVYFGCHPSLGDFFDGNLDDAAIYNRALTQSEITGLYNAGTNTNTCLPSYLPTTGLVGYWPFCGNANDESGNGNNGTVTGATLTSDRTGNANAAYDFNGSSSLIEIPDTNKFNFSRDFTISSWVNAINFGTQRSIVTKYKMLDDAFSFDIKNGKLSLQTASSPANWITATSNQNLQSNTWYHLVGIKDYTNRLFKLYVNGELIFIQTCNDTTSRSGANLIFGNYKNNALNPSVVFSGKLDDIAIYNRALSTTEVQNLYNASAPTSCIANIINNDTTICRGQSVTLNATAVASGSVTDINGNVYPTVNIGSQTWMQKNLNVSKYKNGDVIPQVTDATQWANLTTGAWCWYNNDSATYAATYGKLYNWYAVNDSRGFAPQGWHVPSDSEWNLLETHLGGSSVAGGLMKEVGTSHWFAPNLGATNSSGFFGLPGSSRYASGVFNYSGPIGDFWSSTVDGTSNAWSRYLYYSYTDLFRSTDNKAIGFSVRCLKNTSSTYLWSTGATTPSITVSPTVTTTYYLTVTDANGNICRDSVKVFVNTAIPSAPATLTGATDVCSYFSSITSATSNAVTYTAATVSTASSYTWTVPAGVTIVSGQGTNSITVTFASTFVSGAITVKSVNACGSSTAAKSLTVYKRVAATPGVIQKEFTPTSIVAVTNVTGIVSETYRIKKVTYATSYNWSMNQGTSATITHINPLGVNDTAVIVTFLNCFVRDTLSVKAVTPCSVSTAKTAILIANTAAASVAGIGTAGGDFAVCIGTNKTFNAIAGTPTSAQAPIASFRWTKPVNTTIVSAASDSSSITVSFNTGFTGGSLTAKGVTACGVIGTTTTTAILQYLPPTPLSISSSTNSYNACINSTVTYTAIVGAPTTSQTPTSVFRWTKPNNTTITAASADSSSITLRFNTGYVGGTLSVKGQSRCGTQGGTKSQSLTHTGCAAGTKMSLPITATTANSFEVSLYPNPSAGEFKLLVNLVGGKTSSMATNLVGGKTPTMATVKVIDLQGRLIKSFECIANRPTAIGNELKPGVYMVEVRMGDEVKTVRAVRF